MDENWGSCPALRAQPVPVGGALEAVPALESDTPWVLQLFSLAGILRINFYILNYSFK